MYTIAFIASTSGVVVLVGMIAAVVAEVVLIRRRKAKAKAKESRR